MALPDWWKYPQAWAIEDCLDVMQGMPDKCVDLVLTDPPYNIGKDTWDKWKSREEYLVWCAGWLKEVERVLKDNGSLYFFHSEMIVISRLMCWIEENTNMVFKQFIVWNKRFDGSKNKGFLDGYVVVDGLRNYQQMAEYCLYYVSGGGCFNKWDVTGLERVKLDVNNFQPLRQYFRQYQEALGIGKKEIIEKVGQKADHCFRWNSSQWDLPTSETYAELGNLPLEYEFVRKEYEDLWKEYEDLWYTFNNQKTHHSVWNYDIAKGNGHTTPKPEGMIMNIIRHSSEEGDIVFDPFLGSGTTLLVCRKTGRVGIGCEINKEYEPIIRKRCLADIPKITDEGWW